MATRFLRIAPVIALAVAAISLQAAPASAEETSAPYQKFLTKDCGSVSSCFLEFPAISNRNDVVITSISCLITALDTASKMISAYATVFDKNGDPIGKDALIPAYTNTAPIGAFHAINTQTTLLLRGGSKVELTLSASKIATTIAECKMAGHIVK
jgi:hypothetical protein